MWYNWVLINRIIMIEQNKDRYFAAQESDEVMDARELTKEQVVKHI